MTEYEKSYIKWFVVAFIIGFAVGMVLKGFIMMIPAYKEGNLGLDALASFITPICCVLSQVIMLGIYGKKKQEAMDERDKETEKKMRYNEEAQDDIVLNYEGYDDGKEAVKPVVYDDKRGILVEIPKVKPVTIEKVEGIDANGKEGK